MTWSPLMKSVNLVLDLLSAVTNLTALAHVARSFDLKTHVFFLTFIDALISSVCAILSIVVDVVWSFVDIKQFRLIVCSIDFLTHILPSYLGAFLTFLVTSIRFLVTVKGARNQPLSHFHVSLTAAISFSVLVIFILTYIIVNSVLDLPYSFTVEACTRTTRSAMDIRPISSYNVIVMQVPNFFNILSLLVDLGLIR